MARIKHTKNELKAQRDALRRFERYLPTLQLKKQQLQIEVRHTEHRLAEKESEEKQVRSEIAPWVQLFCEEAQLQSYLRLDSVETMIGNVAGVNIPLLQDVKFAKKMPDLFATPSWVDDALLVVERLIRLRVEQEVIREQLRLLAEELRTTTQRVNLFERVKIPEAQENIRVIRIFLGDQQTSEVARSKIAKGKGAERATAG